MAVTQCMPTSAKLGFISGTYVTTDSYKIALYLASGASFDAASTVYSTTGEITGTGYTAGGIAMSGFVVGSAPTSAWIDWTTDPSWPSATFTADSAIIYNTTRANAIVAILSFGTATATAGTFTIILPVAAASTAIIRIA